MNTPKRYAPLMSALAALLVGVGGCSDRTPSDFAPTGVDDFTAQATNAAGEPVLSNGSEMPTEGSHGSHQVIVTSGVGVEFTKTTFEFGLNEATIHPGQVIPGTVMRFPGWLTLIDSDAGGGGNFANEPSAETIAFWRVDGAFSNTSRDVTFDEPVSDVSLFYTSSVPVTLEGFDAGNILVDGTGGLAQSTGGPGGDPTGSFNLFSPLAIDAGANVITRVRFTGSANQTGIDDFEYSQITLCDPDPATDCGEATVDPNQDATITPASGFAQFQIPAGTFDVVTQVSVTLLQGDDCPATLTAVTALLDCLFIETDPPGRQLQESVFITLCLPAKFVGHVELFALTEDGEFVALQNIDVASNVDCTGFGFAQAAPGGHPVFRFASDLLHWMTQPLRPQPLYAAIAMSDFGVTSRRQSGGFLSNFIWAEPLVVREAEVKKANKAGKGGFEVEGRLLDGFSFDPATDKVIVTFGECKGPLVGIQCEGRFAQEIPPGSFERDDDEFEFEAEDQVSGIEKMEIDEDGRFEIEARGLDLAGIVDLTTDEGRHVSFTVKIGDVIQGAGITLNEEGQFESEDDDDGEDDENDN